MHILASKCKNGTIGHLYTLKKGVRLNIMQCLGLVQSTTLQTNIDGMLEHIPSISPKGLHAFVFVPSIPSLSSMVLWATPIYCWSLPSKSWKLRSKLTVTLTSLPTTRRWKVVSILYPWLNLLCQMCIPSFKVLFLFTPGIWIKFRELWLMAESIILSRWSSKRHLKVAAGWMFWSSMRGWSLLGGRHVRTVHHTNILWYSPPSRQSMLKHLSIALSWQLCRFFEGLEKIGPGAFYGCTSLQAIFIPPSVKVIDWDAFDSCRQLKTAKLSGTRYNY